MKNFKLIGHSGCRLEIEKHGNCFRVNKTSKNVEYNDRLKQQHDKQRKFDHTSFKAPIIFNSRINKNNLFSFSMEYISGLTLAEHFNNIEISSIINIANKFLEIIPKNYNFDKNARKKFLAKINELKNKINYKDNAVLEKAFKQLEKYGWEYCVASSCHGDLTLENVIWKDGELYLIDFLDSFYDSWMVDLAKMFQDLDCFWSYRHIEKIDENLKIRLLIFKQLILDKLLSLKEGPRILEAVYYILLINLLRIIPYTESENIKKYLEKKISLLLTKLITN